MIKFEKSEDNLWQLGDLEEGETFIISEAAMFDGEKRDRFIKTDNLTEAGRRKCTRLSDGASFFFNRGEEVRKIDLIVKEEK